MTPRGSARSRLNFEARSDKRLSFNLSLYASRARRSAQPVWGVRIAMIVDVTAAHRVDASIDLHCKLAAHHVDHAVNARSTSGLNHPVHCRSAAGCGLRRGPIRPAGGDAFFGRRVAARQQHGDNADHDRNRAHAVLLHSARMLPDPPQRRPAPSPAPHFSQARPLAGDERRAAPSHP